MASAVLIVLLCAVAPGTQTTAPPHTGVKASEVVARWRAAIHAAEPTKDQMAVITTSSDKDDLRTHVEEWLTTRGNYRAVVTRDLDESEVVVTERSARGRDWNGFVREIQGRELARLRTAIFEKQAIVFGPPNALGEAAVNESDDRRFFVLRFAVPEGRQITWYVDEKTWLPVRSVVPGDGSEITTEYENWHDRAGVLRPDGARVRETDKPEYRWDRTALRVEKSLAKRFDPPAPGPTDALLDAMAPPIPFNFENSHIMLEVSVNGHEPIWFILDTGADHEYINEPRLAQLGLQRYGKSATTGGGNAADLGYATGATFTLPGIELRNQHVAVLDQTGLEHALGMPLVGLLGYDFISRFVVEIDYERKLITLHDSKTWSYAGSGYVVAVTFDEGIPFVEGTIAFASKPHIPATFVVDFGAAETMTLTSPFVKANDLLNLAATNATVNRPAGLENQFFAQNNVRGRIDQLTLGRLTVESIPVNLSVNTSGAYSDPTFAGTVGESLYRRYHVFLDYARNRVILEPTPEAAKPFPERMTYGLSLVASGSDLHTYTASAIRPGSPAERDGFERGDVVAAVDGKPSAQFTLGELREWLSHEGARHELQVVRGSERKAITIDIRLVSLDRR